MENTKLDGSQAESVQLCPVWPQSTCLCSGGDRGGCLTGLLPMFRAGPAFAAPGAVGAALHAQLRGQGCHAVSRSRLLPPHLPGSMRSYWRRLEQGNEGVSSLQATEAGPCLIWRCGSKPKPGESRPCLRRDDVPGDSGCELGGSQQKFASRGSGGWKSQIKMSAGPGILPVSSSFRRLLAILGLWLHPPHLCPPRHSTAGLPFMPLSLYVHAAFL